MGPTQNNSFGSFNTNSQAMGLGIGSGDVVLPQTDSPNKKRNIVILCAVLLVLMAVAIIAIVLGLNSKSDNYTSLQRYKNYMINGDETNNDRKVSEESYGGTFFREKMDAESGEFSDFYNKAIELLDKAEADLSGEYSTNEQRGLLKMYLVYRTLDFEDRAIIDLYLKDGTAAILDSYINEIESLDDLADDYVSSFKASALVYVVSLLNLVDGYRNTGCVIEKPDDLNTCYVTNTFPESSALYKSIMDEQLNMENMIESSLPRFAYLVNHLGEKDENN